MAVSVQSLINRAYRLAVGTGGDAHASPVVDNVWAFEEAFPHALSRAVEEIGFGPEEIEHYRRAFDLTFVNGVATLSGDVVHRFLDRSSLSSITDASVATNSSFCNRVSEFLNPPHTALHYYTTVEGEIWFREASGSVDTFDGNLTLYAIGYPATPASITGTMAIPEDIADRTVEIMAEMIRGSGE
jgi:hypothetical protein